MKQVAQMSPYRTPGGPAPTQVSRQDRDLWNLVFTNYLNQLTARGDCGMKEQLNLAKTLADQALEVAPKSSDDEFLEQIAALTKAIKNLERGP